MSVATFGVTSASASLSGDVARTVGSVVSPVTAPAAPSLPSAQPSTPPPPEAPQAPATPPVTATSPPPPSPPANLASGATKAVDSVTGVLGDGGKASGGVTGSPSKAATTVSSASREVAPSASGNGGSVPLQGGSRASAPSAGAGAAKDDPLPAGTAPRRLAGPSAPPSIESARAAPLQRWLARVWPAIELGRDGSALATWEGGPPRTALDVVARLLVMGAARASATADPTLSAHAARSDAAARPAPVGIPVPDRREITFFVIFSFAALLALLLSTLWVEVRSKYLYR
jgi:hypothetical protein